jgi:hypothetical protein
VSENETIEPSPPAGHPGSPPSQPDAAGADADAVPPKRPGRFHSLLSQLRSVGRDVVSVARGKLIEAPPTPSDSESSEEVPAEVDEKSGWRISMLHSAAEQLRGAADNYIAAKLDEIEARVDAKLDHVETRIDAKIVELHRQLREMRDRELRHRLRLLKITLIFTVLVALLSLGYKWFARYVVG